MGDLMRYPVIKMVVDMSIFCQFLKGLHTDNF
jgi:hypothetical protein